MERTLPILDPKGRENGGSQENTIINLKGSGLLNDRLKMKQQHGNTNRNKPLEIGKTSCYISKRDNRLMRIYLNPTWK
jgi:hypothetical protein